LEYSAPHTTCHLPSNGKQYPILSGVGRLASDRIEKSQQPASPGFQSLTDSLAADSSKILMQ
jgi:hypothetical protein